MQKGCRRELLAAGCVALPEARLPLSGLGELKIEAADLGATGLSFRPREGLTLSLWKAFFFFF